MNAQQYTVANRAPVVQPPAVLSEYPRFAYCQTSKEVDPVVVKSEEELKALGADWDIYPWSAKPIDRTPKPNLPGVGPGTDFQGTEFPCFVYHQLSEHESARVIKDEEEAEKLGPEWGPLPYTKERARKTRELIEAQQKLAAIQAEEDALQAQSNPSNAEPKSAESNPAPAEVAAPSPAGPSPAPPSAPEAPAPPKPPVVPGKPKK